MTPNKTLWALPMACCLLGFCDIAAAQKTLHMNSSSMAPTMAEGYPMKVNLFAYLTSSPQRWDVITYRGPDGKSFLTKRVVGLPGDTITYDGQKRLHINGIAVKLSPARVKAATDDADQSVFVESMEAHQHLIQMREGAPPVMMTAVQDFEGRDRCRFSSEGFRCEVPPDHYFVMGDNRDSSRDSRYIGFVPAGEIGGRVENALRPAAP